MAKARRRWWLVSEGSAVDLCLTDPGYEVELFIVTDLHTMTAVWIGDTKLGQAMASGRLEMSGPHQLRVKFGSWLGLSPFAAIKNQRGPDNTDFASPTPRRATARQ